MNFYIDILPVPPSANQLYWNKRGYRTKTQVYKNWLNTCKEIHDEKLGKEHTPLELHKCYVHIVAYVNYQRDIDNLIKPVIDFLGFAKVIGDDRYIEKITCKRYVPGKDPTESFLDKNQVLINVTPYDTEEK